MKTLTMPAQVGPAISVLPKIPVHANVLPAPDSSLRKERVVEEARETMAARLAKFPLFAGMTRRQMALLASCAKTVQFKKGEVIFREGDLADRLYLIETGRVSLEASSGMLDPRLGWSWMFPPQTRAYTVHAVEPITAIFFDGKVLRECCENDHSLGYELLKRLSYMMYQRLQAVQKRMLATRNQGGTLDAGQALAA